jgi:hypothetical protein
MTPRSVKRQRGHDSLYAGGELAERSFDNGNAGSVVAYDAAALPILLPPGVVAFIAAQFAGMLITGVAVASWMWPSEAMSKGLWKRRD